VPIALAARDVFDGASVVASITTGAAGATIGFTARAARAPRAAPLPTAWGPRDAVAGAIWCPP
jgi:hypothetical protein